MTPDGDRSWPYWAYRLSNALRAVLDDADLSPEVVSALEDFDEWEAEQ